MAADRNNGAVNPWTPELEDLLYRKVIRGPMSFGMAAKLPEFAKLGLTRNALIGKATRKGWSEPRTDPRKFPQPKHGYGLRALNAQRKRKADTYVIKLKEVATEQAPLHLHITQLTNASCRYIYGETSVFVSGVRVPLKEYTYCGIPEADVAVGRCFCKAHHALVYVPVRAYQKKKKQMNWKTRR